MRTSRTIWKPLLYSVGLSLLVSLLPMLFIRNFSSYVRLQRPPFSPAPMALPIIWGLTHTLAGAGVFFIHTSYAKKKGELYQNYAWLLALSLLLPIVFFDMKLYIGACVLCAALIIHSIILAIRFLHADLRAGLFLFPYTLSMLYILYVSLGVFLLNR